MTPNRAKKLIKSGKEDTDSYERLLQESKPIKLKADGIGVDAGIIIVADADYFKGRCEHSTEDYTFTKVPKGTYQVTWKIPDTWNGPQSGTTTLKVSSGNIIVSDPCYIIPHEDWSDWLDQTNYGKVLATTSAFIVDSMGGDGCYKITLNLKRIPQ